MAEPRQDGRAQAVLAEVETAARSGDWTAAFGLAEDALSKGLEHPRLLQMRAIGRERRGELADAQDDLERARELAPEDVGLAMASGVLLRRRNQPTQAAPLFKALAAKHPDVPVLHFHLASALLDSGDHAGARAAFERVTILDPKAAEAFGKLALLASHRGDFSAARDLALKALSIKSGDQDARRVLIEAALHDRKFEDAASFAQRWLSEPDIGGATARMHALSLLGDAYEGLDRAADAYSAYRESNAIFREINASARQPVTPLLHAMKAELRSSAETAWPVTPSLRTPSPARAHVFLLGFMRSGTTLLEQALGRHPAVVSLEEIEALTDSAHLLIPPNGLDHLARLTEDEAETYRASYWRTVRDAGVEPDGKVFIDKMPFNGAKLPLICKLFPDAKIIFAVRDPRDVVFSCFQRRLKPGAYTLELADLQDGARLYDAYMGFVQACRETLPLSLLSHRHEDLLEDFQAGMKEVCDFVGLDFRPDMANFDAAVAEDKVMSQTARQLQGGLSKRGVGRWRAYTEALRPALPILEPWVKAYGYEPSPPAPSVWKS